MTNCRWCGICNFENGVVMSSDEAVKAARTMMRRVQEHLRSAHLSLGARLETIGHVDVLHHESSTLPGLNYVMPRRGTAWIPGKHIEDGLSRLRDQGRTPRVLFADGLYLPEFVRTLRDIGLHIEQETPIMLFRHERGAVKLPALTPEVSVAMVRDHHATGIWWYVWRNAYYDVITTGIEPISLGQEMRDFSLGSQLNLILYRYGFPVGVARLTLHEQSAHLVSLAIMQEVRTSELLRMLHSAALRAAIDAGCDMVFAAGETDDTRQFCRELGFIDAGSVVCYVENEAMPAVTREQDNFLAQPVLIL